MPCRLRLILPVATTAILAWALTTATAQEAAPPQPKPKPAPPAASTRDGSREQLLLDELRVQALEDLEMWEARLKSRKAWVREATLRADQYRTIRDHIEKRVKLGYETNSILVQNEVELAESEARRDQKVVELKEAESRVARLKRRLALLQKADKYDLLDPLLAPLLGTGQASPDARIADLEQQLERVREELDEIRPISKTEKKNANPYTKPVSKP